MDPLVSIIIPTYNRAKLIVNTLDSILTQSYNNFEVIVVDDGSTDNTESVLNDYKQKFLQKSINFYSIKQDNAGAPAGRNRGFQNSHGEYVVFFDSDDVMLPNRIEEQVKCLQKEQSDCCACGFYLNDTVYLPHINKKGAFDSFVKGILLGSTQIWMYKTELIQKLNGYDERFVCFQDNDLTFRVIKENPKISLLPLPLAVFIEYADANSIMGKWQTEEGIASIVLFYNNVWDTVISRKEFLLYHYAIKRFYYYTVNKTLKLKSYMDMFSVSTKYISENKSLSIVVKGRLICISAFNILVRYFLNILFLLKQT